MVRHVERDRSVEILHDFWENFKHNLFKPLLLFFYMGFSVPILKVGFEFPYVIYQGLTIYLLVAIGWHGGEELAALSGAEFRQAGGFMIVGFILNFILGILAYFILRAFTRLRKVDAATVAAYYRFRLGRHICHLRRRAYRLAVVDAYDVVRNQPHQALGPRPTERCHFSECRCHAR